MREAYSKLLITGEHNDRDTRSYRRAHLNDIRSSRAGTQEVPDISSTGVGNPFNDEPANHTVKEFLKFPISPSNDVFYILNARLDETTNMIDALNSSFDYNGHVSKKEKSTKRNVKTPTFRQSQINVPRKEESSPPKVDVVLNYYFC